MLKTYVNSLKFKDSYQLKTQLTEPRMPVQPESQSLDFHW